MEIKILKHSDLLRCPMVILLPEHYRVDGSCRCNETMCEWEGCASNKYSYRKGGQEIYCKRHLNWRNRR